MTGIDPARWQALSIHLDRALDLSPKERVELVENLRKADPVLAHQLDALLAADRAVRAEHFLEGDATARVGSVVEAGQELGAYRLVSLIGSGGMGSVWLSERTDGRFERKAAIKFLNANLVGREADQRFRREGSLLARLSHPHIAQLIDAGITQHGQPYLVLEHVDGEPIDEYCDHRRLGIDARLELFLDMASAVSHAHAHLVVHRDLKPSNVLVTSSGDVKLLDFGIAKLLGEEAQARSETMLTRAGATALTPLWAAPEQVTGQPVSTATDVYAVGGLLYLLLCGRAPAGDGQTSPAELVKAIVELEAPAMSSNVASGPANLSSTVAANRAATPDKLQRRLQGDLDTIAHKALKKDPRERYASVDDLAGDVRRFLAHEPIAARADTFAYRAAKFARRNRTAVALATFAAVAVIAGLIGTLQQARAAREQRDFAVRQLARVEAVNDLNQFLLTDAAPSGRPFTVNELLAQAEQIVARQRARDDAQRADLLLSIGTQYRSQDEEDSALRVLNEAYSASRSINDPSIRARASCALAQMVVLGKDSARAQDLIREGLRELPQSSQYAFDRVFCLRYAAYAEESIGEATQAIAYLHDAQRELKRAPYSSEMLELRVYMDLAEAQRVAGNHREASAAFAQAAKHLAQLGRDRTATAGTLYNNWALSLDQLGRPRDAEPIFRKAIELSRVDASDDAVSPMLLVNYSRPLRDMGRLDESASNAERAYEKARALGYEVVVNQALISRATTYRFEGRLADSAAMLAEVEPRLRKALPPGHVAFASLQSEKALLAQARGEIQSALSLADESVAIVEAAMKSGGMGADFMPTVLIKRADIELDLHRWKESAADAAKAIELLNARTPTGIHTSHLGRAYYALGRALEGQHDPERAKSALQASIENLEDAAGPDNPTVRAARAALKDIVGSA